MRAIEMNSDDISEILKHLPKELKEKLAAIIRPDSGLDDLKEFIEQYEDDNMLDHILCHTMTNLLKKISRVAHGLDKERKAKKEGRLTTIDCGLVVIGCLLDEAKMIQEAIDSHNKDCDKGEKCGAKH